MTKVVLHLYDLSQGMARAMSMGIIGKQLDGIWHSGIAVFGIEYFYGGGICAAPAGRAIPHLSYQEISLGETTKTQIELETFLQSINHRFTQATYSLLRHNCNNFANEVAVFLTGKGIPEHIIRLPQEFLTSPMGAALAPMIEGMEQRMRNELVGDGRGLNPFAHIQGRTLLFSPAPAVTDWSSSKPIKNDDSAVSPVWLEGDNNLLKTAVDGVPTTIMSAELKARIIALDKSIAEELVSIMKREFKEKTAILLTFATIVRFFWKTLEFRSCMLKSENLDFIHRLIETCIEFENPHVSNAGLAAAVNVAADMNSNMSILYLDSISPKVFTKYSTVASAKKLLPMLSLNLMVSLPFTANKYREYTKLLKSVLKVATDFKQFEDQTLAKRLMKSIDGVAESFLESHNEATLGDGIEVEDIISMVESVDRDLKVEMPHLIRLLIE